jgi:hypothetical protein
MRKTVFVSSTFRDLADHRRAVWELLEKFDLGVRGMEAFGARTEGPLETCLAEVEQSNIYVGLIGFRLGSVAETSGKSFTQLEYERALELGLEILICLRDEESPVRLSDIDRETIPREKLASFKRTLRENHTVDTFGDPADLVVKLKRDLQRRVGPRQDEVPIADFEISRKVLERFLLLPKSHSGSEIRLRVKVKGQPFPASRGLCKAFNLPYGATIGTNIEIGLPGNQPPGAFSELFASGQRVDEILARKAGEVLDIFARLQFSPEDSPRSRARLFGEYVYVGPDSEDPDPYTEYRPAQGRVMLLFSKFADDSESKSPITG